VHDRLVVEGAIHSKDVLPAPAATEAELLRVHTADYVGRFLAGELSAAEQRRLGFPWTPSLRERAQHATGGTLVAARAALEDGLAANLAGGSHHAFADHGEGYCAFHDMAVAIRALRAEGQERRVAVIDCDVHQGNGTAAIFTEDPKVFTFSIHCESNYPAKKIPGTRDVGLADRVEDEEYLHLLEAELDALWERFRPELVFYQAGVDPLAGDRLGRLSLSLTGLRRRDQAVLGRCVAAGVPAVVTMGGGYGRTLEDTVEAHTSVIRTACALASGRGVSQEPIPAR
jgi:acetoin utilization deacetylase AcuC-like enzyme